MRFGIVSLTVSRKTHTAASSYCSKDPCSSLVEIPSSLSKRHTAFALRRMANSASVACVLTFLMLVSATAFAGNDGRPHMVPIESRNQPLTDGGPETPSAIGNKSDASPTALGFYMSPGILLETSDYDQQHNSGMARQVAVGADSRVHLVWTFRSTASGGDLNARAVHYTSYKDGILDPVFDVSGALAKTTGRFCTVDVFQNRGLVVNHYGSGPATTSALDGSSGGYTFTAEDPPSGVVNCQGIKTRGATVLSPYIWPVAAADQDGSGHLVIHIAASENRTSTGYNAITYFRGVSSDVAMDAGMYGTCGIFIDSSCTSGYDIAADPYSDRVVIAYPKAREANLENNDLAYRLSTNLGATWGSVVNVTNFATGAKERCGEEVSVLFTADNCFHILYIGNIYDSVAGTVSNQEAKLYHWSNCEPTQRSLVLDASNHDDACNTPAFEYNVCKINLTQCYSSALSAISLYATYTRYLGTTASPDCSDKKYPNGEVFISPSSTWGETWGAPVNLTNTNTNGCLGTAGSYCADDRYTSCARYSTDSLRIEYMEDLDAGSFVANESATADLDNPVRFLSYPCIAMATYQILTCTPNSIKYPFHAVRNATATQDLLLTNRGNQSISWTSSLVGGNVPVAVPGSGTVPAGYTNSATITVTVGPKSTEGLFHNTIRFTYDNGTKTLDVPVDFYVFDNWFLKQDVAIRTAANRMVVNQVGQAADSILGSSFTYFADNTENFVKDASLIMGNSAQNLSWRIFESSQGDPGTPSNNFGWLYALTNTSVDSTTYPGPYGYTFAQGSGTNRDSTVGFDVKWYAAKHVDSADFYVGHFEVYKGTKGTGDVAGLDIAFACDWDVPSDTLAHNTAGIDASRQMIYLKGEYTATRQQGYAATSAYREDGAAITGGFAWGSNQQVYPSGGYQVDSVWKYMQATTNYNSTWLDSVGDMSIVMVIAKNYTVTSTSRFKFDIVLGAKRAEDNPIGLTGLNTAVDKAKSFICTHVASGSQLCRDCSSCGDVNSDGHANTIADAVYILRYIFNLAPAPNPNCGPYSLGDVDTCGSVNVADAAYLMNYICFHGNPPCQRSTTCYQSSSADRITLGCPVSAPVDGDSVAVPIYVTNSVPLLGLSIGFRHNSSDAEVTSVDFAGSVADSINSKSAYLLPDSNKILIGLMGDYRGILQPQTNGLLATMWLRTNNATAQVINFDTCFVAPAGEFIFAPQSGGAIRPAYVDCGAGDVIIPLRPPHAAFSFAPDSGFAPLTVQMTDQSALTPISWRWSFGDGDSSTQQSPSHVYQLPGTYHPQLIACNMQGCDTAAATHPIRVFDSLTVDLSAALTHGRKPLFVSFNPQFSLQPDSVRWLFGDGETSTTPNPTHRYQSLGSYDVTLKAYKFGSMFRSHKPGFITVSDINANFAANPRCGGAPLGVTFTDLSTSSYPLIEWSWNFGDDQTSTVQNPAHQYTSTGAFDVTLIVTDGIGADTLTREGYVTTQQSLSVDFTGGPTRGRSPLTVMFDPVMQGIANEYHWDFGDDSTSTLANPIHIYQLQGAYNVRFKARLNLDGCDQADSIIKSAYIIVNDLQPDFVASPTAGYEPLTVQFTDSSRGNPTSWFWDFGDGSNSYTQSPSHIYDTNGTYNVFLRVTNALGVDSLERLSYIYVDSSYLDLCGEIYAGSARPGFPIRFYYVWTNAGTESAQNSVLKMLLPPEVEFDSVNVHTHTGTYTGYSLSGDTLLVSLETIAPSSWYGGCVRVFSQIPETVPIGDTLVCKSWLTTTSPESHLANNDVVAEFIVVGSLDPNDKIADPGGKELSFGLASDQRINYTVQFENKEEATAEAIYVRVVDTLDTDLDWGTLSIGPMSHPGKCVASFDPYKGIITWLCDSIMLPPNVTPPEGEGYVTYSIKPKRSLSVGTEISNSAWIRFDYNPWLCAPKNGPIVRTIKLPYLCGDANGDATVDISDAVYLISYIFSGGSAPSPLLAGDANCDSAVDISDAVYLIAYIFSGGQAPCAACK